MRKAMIEDNEIIARRSVEVRDGVMKSLFIMVIKILLALLYRTVVKIPDIMIVHIYKLKIFLVKYFLLINVNND